MITRCPAGTNGLPAMSGKNLIEFRKMDAKRDEGRDGLGVESETSPDHQLLCRYGIWIDGRQGADKTRFPVYRGGVAKGIEPMLGDFERNGHHHAMSFQNSSSIARMLKF